MQEPPPLLNKCLGFTRHRELMEEGIYPYFQPFEESYGPVARLDGREIIMVGSNNYLGLTHHPRVKEAAVAALNRFGTSCSGSRFLNGTLGVHEELERKLARFMGKDSALVFSTGFQTNLAVISSLAGKGDIVYCDRDNHASLIDGCRLSFATTKKFKHNSMPDLENLIENHSGNHFTGGRLIAVDGIFSMFGDILDLPGIVSLAKSHDACILLDDAHSLGVLGKTGRGTAEHFGLMDQVDIIMGTFSKSFASLGGFIAGEQAVIEYIQHHSRPLIFSASMPPACVATVIMALDLIQKEPEMREKLWKNTRRMKREFDRMGFDTGNSETPVIQLIIGSREKTFLFWRKLLDHGVYANAVTSPAVPPNMDLIRTSYMATHEEHHLDRVLEVFEELGREYSIIDPSRAHTVTSPAAPDS
ncbi:MAG: aminotransferase class I/II-fold pyridoxal phosphate-dependent enzyme [Planctomycetota bacterium]|nr:aminotransferase class I/II-fold pyridoxal phosphate-dependent enzyme [Planctomycetota bacterium]